MRVIVISVLLFIRVVVADEAGVAINPAEEARIGETVDSVKEAEISVAINPAEEAGIGETVDPAEEAGKISETTNPMFGMNAFFHVKFSKKHLNHFKNHHMCRYS